MGTSDLGLASAGRAARAQDPSVIAANPAGLARLEGSQIVRGVQGLMGKVAYEAGPGASAGGDGGNALDFTPGGSLFASHAVDGR